MYTEFGEYEVADKNRDIISEKIAKNSNPKKFSLATPWDRVIRVTSSVRPQQSKKLYVFDIFVNAPMKLVRHRLPMVNISKTARFKKIKKISANRKSLAF